MLLLLVLGAVKLGFNEVVKGLESIDRRLADLKSALDRETHG